MPLAIAKTRGSNSSRVLNFLFKIRSFFNPQTEIYFIRKQERPPVRARLRQLYLDNQSELDTCLYGIHDKWVSVTTALNVLRLRSLGQPTRGYPQGWELGEVLTNRDRKSILSRNVHNENLGPGPILWYDISSGKGT